MQFSTTFNHEHSGKVSTYISCVSTKLEKNYKGSFSKAVKQKLQKYISRILEIREIS